MALVLLTHVALARKGQHWWLGCFIDRGPCGRLCWCDFQTSRRRRLTAIAKTSRLARAVNTLHQRSPTHRPPLLLKLVRELAGAAPRQQRARLLSSNLNQNLSQNSAASGARPLPGAMLHRAGSRYGGGRFPSRGLWGREPVLPSDLMESKVLSLQRQPRVSSSLLDV